MDVFRFSIISSMLLLAYSQLSEYNFKSSIYRVEEGEEVKVVVFRTSTDVSEQSLIVVIQNGTTDDIIGTSAIASFQPSDLETTVIFSTVDDVHPESDELFILQLRSLPDGPAEFGDRQTSRIVISANDNAAGVFSLQSREKTILTEGDTAMIEVIRSAGAFGNIKIFFEIANGFNEIQPFSGSIEFADGARNASVLLTALDDNEVEDKKLLVFRIFSNHSEILVSDAVKQIEVMDNDILVSFAKEIIYVHEMTTAYSTVIGIKVDKGQGTLMKNFTVAYEVLGKSADADSDYILANNVATFTHDELHHNISILILADDVPELTEKLQIILTAVDGDAAISTPNTTTVAILGNDDQHGVVMFDPSQQSPLFINEDQTVNSVTILIRRQAGVFGEIVIFYNVSGNELLLHNIQPLSGEVLILDKQSTSSFTLQASKDVLPEISQLFKVSLVSVSGGARLDGVQEKTVIIQDSDVAHGTIQWLFAAHSIVTDTTPRYLTWTLDRSGGSIGEIAVTFTCSYFVDGTTIPNAFVSNRPYQAVMADGQVSVRVTVDISPTLFLSVGGRFAAIIDEVKLISEFPAPSFNSPYKGALQSDTIEVESSNANGEIGFSDLATLRVTEPNSGINMVSIPISREGTSGVATVFWTVEGVLPSAVDSNDMHNLEGSVVLQHGVSVVNVELKILADNISETDEFMVLRLSAVLPANTQRFRENFTQVSLVVPENDNPGGVFKLTDDITAVKAEGEKFMVSVERVGGDLVARTILLSISDDGEGEFYGATSLLEFAVGERLKSVQIYVADDSIPEVAETYLLSIKSHGEPLAVIGSPNSINITILENDSPYGIIHFLPEASYLLYESKGTNISTVEVLLVRDAGLFGEVSVRWTLVGNDTQDLHPTSGTVEFGPGEDTALLSISSRADELPEYAEDFSIELISASEGVLLVSPTTTTVTVSINDAVIYFKGPPMINTVEGNTVRLIVSRADPSTVASVKYRTRNHSADFTDYIKIDGEIKFVKGQSEAVIEIEISDDNNPETLEFFYVQLYDPRGNVVVDNLTEVIVMIAANDNSNGVFNFAEPYVRSLDEGETLSIGIVRSKGTFRSVTLEWQILVNGSLVNPGEEFAQQRGFVTFEEGEIAKSLKITSLADGIPEYNEEYVVKIVNVTGGGPGNERGVISLSHSSINITIRTNDNPNGVMAFNDDSRELIVAEDVIGELVNSTTATFTVSRKQGLFGHVKILWEIYSSQVAGILPEITDLLFQLEPKMGLQVVDAMSREGVQSGVYNFTGEPESYGMLNPEHQVNWLNGDFALSVWIRPDPGCNGYLVLKASRSETEVYYSLRMTADSRGVPVSVVLSLLSYHTLTLSTAQTLWTDAYTNGNQWVNLLVNVGGDVADFIFNGAMAAQKLIPESRVDNDGVFYVGSALSGSEKFTGLMQDFRLFNRKLTSVEISEIVHFPARLDVLPISGVLYFTEGQSESHISLRAVADVEAESNEAFAVKLISAHGGAIISTQDSLAKLTVLKSDYANGLFGFDGQCQPSQASTEGSIYSCLVKRDRGDAGVVTLSWKIYQILANGTWMSHHQDFNSSGGQVVFSPGQIQQEVEFEAVDDGEAELVEHFSVVLESVETADGLEVASLSGASINPDSAVTNISLLENDFPYGLLQISGRGDANSGDRFTIPILNSPATKRVEEDVGVIQLVVERAQGINGEVSVEWKTADGTASSAGMTTFDFVSAVGHLEFSEGQRYAFINITIIDDDRSEDDQYFSVQLLNPTGGAFLGAASTLTVVILHSDDAYGVVQFDTASLTTFVTESDEYASEIDLKVVRTGGLIGEMLVHWSIQDDTTTDFLYSSGTVKLANDESNSTISLQIRPDNISELDETFAVKLINTSHGRLAKDKVSSSVTILANDDPYGVFAIADSSKSILATEGQSVVTITVTRKYGRTGVVSLAYRTVPTNISSVFYPIGVTRADDQDFMSVNGTITFLENESRCSFTISLYEDSIPETDEYFFVELSAATLISGGQKRPLTDSPRIGSFPENFSQVVIKSNDAANGILELSASQLLVSEGTPTSVLSVNRKAGLFGEVVVRFEVIPGNATAGADYFFTSNNVILFGGQVTQQMPIYINDDSFPELRELFTVRLLPFVTGGATLGENTECVVTIEASDDPYGVFEFASPLTTIDEPVANQLQDIRVNRLGGAMGIVAVQWLATYTNTGIPADDDVEPSSGTIYFNSNQASQFIRVHVKADIIPELTELISFNLTHVTNGGRVGLNKVFTMRIRANDNPHGIVEFDSAEYELVEMETTSTQNISISRSGGLFGDLRVYYQTAMIDVSALARDVMPVDDRYLWFFSDPLAGSSNMSGFMLDKSSHGNPLQACAEFCLLETRCSTFSINKTSRTCSWFKDLPSVSELGEVEFYSKVSNRVSNLYNSRAQSGNDYISIKSGSAVILNSQFTSHVQISVLDDFQPELDERFYVTLTDVKLSSGAAESTDIEPTIGERMRTTAVIRHNDDANGVLRIYSRDPRSSDGGQTVFVEEREHLSVELIVERSGGTIGDVFVTWSIDAMATNASRETDYVADGATLTFFAGEDVRVITIGIQDDNLPEHDETLVVQLMQPEGGVLLDARNKVNVVILANDYVAGVVGFTSSSYIAKEGDTVMINVSRTYPAAGEVTVEWKVVNVNQHVAANSFSSTSGFLTFSEGEKLRELFLHIVEDNLPEINEEYEVVLTNISTRGISASGSAIVDPQTRVVSLTVEASNNPHGVFSIASASLGIEFKEEQAGKAHLVVDRKFGSIGAVRIFYTIQSGHLTELTAELEKAQADADFISTNGFIDVLDGENSAPLPLNITDDSVPEVQEVFVVALTGVELLTATGNKKFPPSLSTSNIVTEVFIAANDGTRGQLEFPMSFRIIKVNESVGEVEVAVRRAYGTYGEISVFIYSQTSLNALVGQDYMFSAHELVFQSGENLKTVTLEIIDDEIPEPDESLELVLASPKGGATLGSHYVSLIDIKENDGAGGVVQFSSSGSVFLQESFTANGYPTYSAIKLSRGPGIFGLVEISYTITDSDGVLTDDIEPSNGTITFSNLQQSAFITLSVVDDTFPEFTEHLTVKLNSNYKLFLGKEIEKEIIVSASDYPNGLLSIMLPGNTSEVDVEESINSSVKCQVLRSGGLHGNISVNVRSSSGTASANFGKNLFVSPVQYLDGYVTGYCSSGNILLVLRPEMLEVLEFDGVYSHHSHMQVGSVAKCLTHQNMDQATFLLLSQSQAVVYAAFNDDGLIPLASLFTDHIVDGVFLESDALLLVLLTSTSNSSYSLETYSEDNGSFLSTGNRLQFSYVVTIKTAANLLFVALPHNIKVYEVGNRAWVLRRTLWVDNIKDIAVVQHANSIRLAVAFDSGIRLYQYLDTTFILAIQAELKDCLFVNDFIVAGELIFLVSTSTRAVIFNADLTPAWETNTTDCTVPLRASGLTSDNAVLGVCGDSPSINIVSLLHQPDYVPRTIEVWFREGETQKEVNIPIVDDSIPEDTESFHVILEKPTGGASIGEKGSLLVNILANDNAFGTVQFSESSLTRNVKEEVYDTVVQFIVLREGGSHGTVGVAWTVSANQDISSDISPTNGTVQFRPGQTSVQLSILVKADSTAESDEPISVELTSVVVSGTDLPGRGATLGGRKLASLVILANESPHGVVRWEQRSVLVTEPELAAETTVPLVIVRDQGTLGDLHVTFITSRDMLVADTQQAISGQDYVASQASVMISSGKTQAAVEVVVKADDMPETDEQFLVNITSVRLINFEDAVIQPSVLNTRDVVTIIIAENDNARGIVQFDVHRNNEGRIDVSEKLGENRLLQLKVVREIGYFGEIDVMWQILPRDITVDDVSTFSGSIIFQQSQKEAFIEIFVIDDDLPEPIETFDVQLVSVTGGAVLGASRSLRVAILKNDSPSGMFRFVETLYSVSESPDIKGRTAHIQVERVQGTQGIVNVNWQLDVNAAADFELPHSGVLRYAVGERIQNFTLLVRLDSVLEGEEVFTVRLTSADNNADLSATHSTADITIEANIGSSGHVTVREEYRVVVMGEPDEDYDGTQEIMLSRGVGVFGDVVITWSLTPAKLSSFAQTSGEATFLNGQQFARVVLQAVDNLEPEQRTTYIFQVTSATSGATVSADAAKSSVILAASDYPFGLFEFESSQDVFVSEDTSQVSLMVIRNLGVEGQVEVTYTTSPGTAYENADYEKIVGTLNFTPGQQSRALFINILEDDLAEGPEAFYVELVSAKLRFSEDSYNFTEVQGIRLDQPPGVGLTAEKSIIINENDNAAGTIEFDIAFVSMVIEETVGIASLIVTRGPGTYGNVAVSFNVTQETALANEDFILESGELFIGNGQSQGSIDIIIVDDEKKEVTEFFKIVLTSTRGGALLGAHTSSLVTIAKSDYPNGKFYFLGPYKRVFSNPKKAFSVDLTILRAEGLKGKQLLSWTILGPNSLQQLDAVSDICHIDSDGVETTQGQLSWENNEAGSRTISLQIKEFTGWEIQKEFIVKIIDIQNDENPINNGETDTLLANVTLTILKNGDPNGIIQLSEASRQGQEFNEPIEGNQEITFFVERLEGNLGAQEILWKVTDAELDLLSASGSVVMADGVSVVPIKLSIMADTIPELTEKFQLRLLNVIGGATLNYKANEASFTIKFNDDPHGFFELSTLKSAVLIEPISLQRYLNISVQRQLGLFGSVEASLRVSYSQQSLQFPLTETVVFDDGQADAFLIINIIDDLFIEMTSSFTVQFTNLVYVDSFTLTSPPRFEPSNSILIKIPEVAANSHVSFANSVFSVNEMTNDVNVTFERIGLYGNVLVKWGQGYLDGIPAGFTSGLISPSSGAISMLHGEKHATLVVSTLLPSFSDTAHNLYALSLQSLLTDFPGGAKLASIRTFAEIEPNGVVKFASPRLSVYEATGSVTLTLERLYGSRNSIQVQYSTQSETALADKDFISLQSQFLVMTERQLTAELTVPIQLDSIAEKDEHFTVVLNSVNLLPTTDLQKTSPRISEIIPNCTVTIKENGDPYGLLNVVTSAARVVESNVSSSVRVMVIRNGGTYGRVTVRVRTVGGGESWDQEIGLLAKSSLNNTISEALSNKDSRQSASAAADYQILNEEIVFEEGEIEKELSVYVMDDNEAESDESVFIYLTEPTGGARVAEGVKDGMKYGYASFQITRNDNWNGVISFSKTSQNVSVNEDDGGHVTLTVSRSSHARFTYDTAVQWEAKFPSDLLSTNELVETAGVVVCKSLHTTCLFDVHLKEDSIPEFEYYFFIRLFNPSAGSKVDSHNAWARVYVHPSDEPYGKVELRESFVVVDDSAREVLIAVDRKQGSNYEISVSYKVEVVDESFMAGLKIYSANQEDYSNSRGLVKFEDGVTFQEIQIQLTPENAISRQYPKLFKVVIHDPLSGAVLGSPTDCTVMIVRSQELSAWKTHAAATMLEINDNTIDYLVNSILQIDFSRLSRNGLMVLEDVLQKIIEDGKQRPLQVSSRQGLVTIFCQFMNDDTTSTKGRLSLIKLFEEFLFTLAVGETCEMEKHPYADVFCKNFQFSIVNILPDRVNGFLFHSTSQNNIKLGDNIINPSADNKTCSLLQFIEYNSAHWFDETSSFSLLDDKVLAINIDGPILTPSVSYKVYTSDGKRTSKRAECLYYDEESLMWTAGDDVCRVSNQLDLGSTSYIECECDHLSSYAVRSLTRDKQFIGYPIYIFIICGCCMLCILIAALLHLVCPCDGLFTVEVILHELVCSFCLLGSYLLAAYLSSDTSPDQILVTSEENNYKCTIIGLVLHYFTVSQFIWMLLQSINLWLICTKNDENTRRLHCRFLTFGYGLPALLVGAFYGFTYYIYQENNLNPNFIYTDVNNEREMCFLNNRYTALAGVVAPVVICVIGVFIFMGDISGKAKQWKSYDDIFAGRTNKGEIGSVIFLWLMIILVNMTGGLHMAYNYTSMMVAFCVSLSVLAAFVLGYLVMLRGPCNRTKKNQSASSEKYNSTLLVNTTGSEAMLQHRQIDYPSPIPHISTQIQPSNTANLLTTASLQSPKWDDARVDGPSNSPVAHHSLSTGFDISSLSKRSELSPEDDARDLGELIMALKETRSSLAPHSSLSIPVSASIDDESDETNSHQGAYDVVQRISIADTHL